MIRTFDGAAKAKRLMKPLPAKHRKLAVTKRKEPANPDADQNQGAYRFVGYFPFQGKVWELGGLKFGPVEVGELLRTPPGSGMTFPRSRADVVQPILRMKMRKHGGVMTGWEYQAQPVRDHQGPVLQTL